ncbi:hypothetical protein [Calidifontibacillus oryziterrae]|uniref:hypothetical protein n=1 Tax=Calidifontibacillus oryziterrae TaxID=1191699 RepID=UPI0003133251|nr:hypothetical protein [Calidifontibacillus oryziterrae]
MSENQNSFINNDRSFEELLRYDKDEAFKWLLDNYGEQMKRLIFTCVKNWAQEPSLLELKELATVDNKIYVYDGPHDIALIDTTDIAQFQKLQQAVPDVMKTFELTK